MSHPGLFPETDIADSADRYVFEVEDGDGEPRGRGTWQSWAWGPGLRCLGPASDPPRARCRSGRPPRPCGARARRSSCRMVAGSRLGTVRAHHSTPHAPDPNPRKNRAVVIAGSDGLFDNMWDEQLLAVLAGLFVPSEVLGPGGNFGAGEFAGAVAAVGF